MNSRIVPVAWLLLVLVVMAGLGLRMLSGNFINTNLLSLLPSAETDPVITTAVTDMRKRFERQMVWLIGSSDRDAARAAAVKAQDRLSASGEFAGLYLRHDADQAKGVATFYERLRFGLLTPRAREQLAGGEAEAFERDVLKRYYSSALPVNSDLIEKDPLLLLPAYLGDLSSSIASQITNDEGLLSVQSEGKYYVLLSGRLRESPFSFAIQERLAPILEDIKDDVEKTLPDGTFIGAGVLAHAIAGTRRGLDEMSNFGLWSVIGIIVLLVVVFRSARPLALSLASIGIGVVGGMSACLLIFGQVHMLTMVLGSSLLGISIDYSFHYFCQRFEAVENWSPGGALRSILPGISLGLLTSVVGFAGLWLAPFQGMREIAVFCIAGLCFAFGCVVAWYPYAARGMHHPGHTWMFRVLEGYRALWRNNTPRTALIVLTPLLVVAAIGCARLVAEDNVRLLQTPDPTVLAEETQTRALIGRNLSSQFFLVEGADAAAFLEQSESLTAKLGPLKADGRLAGYQAISDFIPSPKRQRENIDLLAPQILSEDGALHRVAVRVGLSDATRQTYAEDYRQAEGAPPVMLSDWLGDPVSGPFRHLWIGDSGRGVMGIVGLKGVFDIQALRDIAAETPGVSFVDPAGGISDIFTKYRHQTAWLTFASYIVVALVLMLRYGLSGSLMVLAAPVSAAFVSLGVVGLLGEPVNLFNVMALLLVLGVGVDYAIFFREMGNEHRSTFLAIALSSLTTMLAFGLLVMSGTTAVHSFGLTILVGIAVAFLLSPLAGWRRTSRAASQ